MKRLGLVLAMLGLACGSVDEKAECGSSAECPAGEWCASAEGERRCWPDSVAPVASDVTLTCGTTPCLRDGTLRVEAAISDDNEVLAAEATLDLDPSRTIALTRTGVRWGADVALRDFPFERFDGPVTARVTGIDGAKARSAAVDSAPVQVTRLRWEYTAAAALTSPAVTQDGTAVSGVSTNVDQLLAVSSDGAKVWSLTVGSEAVKAAPAVGVDGIWVAGQDGLLSVVALDGSGVLPGGTVQSDGAIDGSVAIAVLPDQEWGFAASRSGRSVAVGATGITARSTIGLASLFGPVVTTSARICSFSTTFLSCFPFDGAFGTPSTVNMAVGISGSLGADGNDFVWMVTAPPATVTRANPPASAMAMATVPSTTFSDSFVLLAGGDVVVGDVENRLHRFAADGSARWTSLPVFTGIPNAPLTMTSAASRFVVSTSSGGLVVLNDDGAVAWETALAAAALRAPNIYTPPGQPAGAVLSTAYISSASGKLYAVIVDGELDTSAPWPKAFHDPRNTNNALQSLVGTGTLP